MVCGCTFVKARSWSSATLSVMSVCISFDGPMRFLLAPHPDVHLLKPFSAPFVVRIVSDQASISQNKP